MTTRTKPIRIFEADHGVVRLAAAAEGRSPAEVVHSALAEYFANHREELTQRFDETRAALAAGDVDAVAAALIRGADKRIDAMMDAE